jgi:uncharacterized protein (DUF488 family)
MPPPLHTIGYERRSMAELTGMLRAAGVAVLIDVRAVPWSRRREFAKKSLAAAAEAAGVRYVHLQGLGNPEEGRLAAKAGRDYRFLFAAHLETPAARADLDRAAAIAAAEPACLMCYEADPARCHRSLVAAELARCHGFEVVDLGRPAQAALFGPTVP